MTVEDIRRNWGFIAIGIWAFIATILVPLVALYNSHEASSTSSADAAILSQHSESLSVLQKDYSELQKDYNELLASNHGINSLLQFVASIQKAGSKPNPDVATIEHDLAAICAAVHCNSP